MSQLKQNHQIDGNKTVRHQDISAPVEKDSSAPRHFGIRTNRYRIFFQTNVITFFKKNHQSAIKLKEKFSQGFI
jgi:hypothetical protein